MIFDQSESRRLKIDMRKHSQTKTAFHLIVGVISLLAGLILSVPPATSEERQKAKVVSKVEKLKAEADSLYAKGQYRKAKRAYRNLEFLSHGEEKAYAKYMIGTCLAAQDKYDQAVQVWPQLVSTNRRNKWIAKGLERIAISYIEHLGQRQRGIQTYISLLQDFPEGLGLDRIQHKLAIAYFQGGNYEKALSSFRKLLANYPDSPLVESTQKYIKECTVQVNTGGGEKRSYSRLRVDDKVKADQLYNLGEYRKAKEEYLRIAKHGFSKEAQYCLYRAGLCLSLEDKFPEAIQTWQTLLKKYHTGPWRDDALLDIARTRAFKLNQLDLALEHYQEFFKKFSKSDRLPEALYQRAWIYYTKKEYTKAKALYESFLKDNPRSFAAGRAGQWLQRCNQALQAAQQPLQKPYHEKRKESVEAEVKGILEKANSHYNHGQYRQARNLYEKIARDLKFRNLPEQDTASYRIGFCFSAEGDYDEAIRAWNELLFRRGESSWANDSLLAMGDTYFEILDKPGDALKAYRRLLKDYPGSNFNSQAKHKMGLCYFRLEKFQEAEKIFRKEFATKPRDENASPTGLERLIDACQKKTSYIPGHGESSFGKATRWVKLGDMYFTSKQYDKARDAYQKAVEEETRSEEGAYALMQMGRSYKQLGQYQQALKCCKKFLAGYKKSRWADDVLFMSGKIYMGPLRDKKKAIEKFSEVVDKYPHGDKADVALYFAGMLYYGDRKYSKALKKFEVLAKEYPKTGFLDNTRKMIKECGNKS